MDYSLPASSLHGILQARILEWVDVSFSRGSSQPRKRNWVSCIASRFFTDWATREALIVCVCILFKSRSWLSLNFVFSLIIYYNTSNHYFNQINQPCNTLTWPHFLEIMIGFCGSFHLHDFYNPTNPSSVNSLNSSSSFLNTIILQSDTSTTALNAQSIFSGLGIWVFLVSQTVKNLPAMQETQVQSLGPEDSLEKRMVMYSSILSWRIPWTEKPHRLQSMGSHRVKQLTLTCLPLPFIT